MKCKFCGAKMKPLFISWYCPRCNDENTQVDYADILPRGSIFILDHDICVSDNNYVADTCGAILNSISKTTSKPYTYRYEVMLQISDDDNYRLAIINSDEIRASSVEIFNIGDRVHNVRNPSNCGVIIKIHEDKENCLAIDHTGNGKYDSSEYPFMMRKTR